MPPTSVLLQTVPFQRKYYRREWQTGIIVRFSCIFLDTRQSFLFRDVSSTERNNILSTTLELLLREPNGHGRYRRTGFPEYVLCYIN